MHPQLDLNFPLADLKGADYNPRFISEDDLQKLRESLAELGCVKPIIVRNQTIVAGHQRTKALRSMGITHGPVYRLEREATMLDEASFNQLHNGTDMDTGDEAAHVVGGFEATGWQHVEPGRLEGNHRAKAANMRNMLGRLLNRYGPFGACVATMSGKVIHCAQYALACAQGMHPLTCYVVADEDEEKYASRLSKTYGVFSYRNLPRTPALQSMAQPYRLREQEGGKQSMLSAIYEGLVLPTLREDRSLRLLDFGSGQGDYARKARSEGLKVVDFEPFRRVAGGKRLDVGAIRRMADTLAADVRRNGLFDIVLNESVLNSVDCLEAESAVLTCLNAFCKPGGVVWIAARDREGHEAIYNATRSVDSSRSRLVFLDADGFSAQFQEGKWFFQKFHTPEQMDALALAKGLRATPKPRKYKINNATLHRWYTKTGELTDAEKRAAVEYEFNLPLGEGVRIDRAAVILDALKIA